MVATIDFQWHVVLPQMYYDDDFLHEHIYIAVVTLCMNMQLL